jgi:hypothetical protein
MTFVIKCSILCRYSQMRGSKNYSFSESVDDARREEVTNPKAQALDSVDGLVGDLNVQFTLEDTNDDEMFEYRYRVHNISIE